MTPALLLLPGWACNDAVWTALLRALGTPPDRFEHTPWAETETAARRPRPGGPRIALAHSLGALAALSAALEQPARFDALILLAATARLPADTGYPGADPRACQAMRVRLRRDPSGLMRDFTALACAPAPARPELFALPTEQTRPQFAAGLARLQETDLRAACRSAPLPPTLLIHGAQDAVVPLASAAALEAALSGRARLAVLPDAGHMLPATHPQPVAELILAFLSGLGHVC